MGLEYRTDRGGLVWVRNPFTGAVTYFTHVHKKRSGFARQPEKADVHAVGVEPAAYEAQLRHQREAAERACPFCPGNEDHTPEEILRLRAGDVFAGRGGEWLIRAVRNLIPRIPERCTGGRNESYVVIEDPRHFADGARGQEDLLYTALLPMEQFRALLAADAAVARRAWANPEVRGVMVRKNQGRGSGASQPHAHNQVIGADMPFPAVARECEVSAREPGLWQEIIAFSREHGFLLQEGDGCCTYLCAFGTFPRSYEVVCPDDWVRLIDLPPRRCSAFAAALHGVLKLLGPTPLDYEVHEGPGVPLHAHVNMRHFAYSNIGGTLNLPSTLLSNPPSA